MTLAELKKQKIEFTAAKRNLLAAWNSSSTLFSNIMSVSEALNDIDIGGKGLDNGEFPEQKTKVNNIRRSINYMIDYCNDKLSEIERLIEIEMAKVNNNVKPSTTSNSSTSSQGNKKPPATGGKFSVTVKE